MPENIQHSMHFAGLEVSVPAHWPPDHVYRFSIPEDDGDAIPGMLKVRGGSGRGFRPNLIVCRVPLREGQAFENFFAAANDAKRSQDRSFEVFRTGTTVFKGRRVTWQDTACVAGPNRTRIFQRELGFEESEGALVMMVFTSDRNNLDQISSPVLGDAVHSSRAGEDRASVVGFAEAAGAEAPTGAEAAPVAVATTGSSSTSGSSTRASRAERSPSGASSSSAAPAETVRPGLSRPGRPSLGGVLPGRGSTSNRQELSPSRSSGATSASGAASAVPSATPGRPASGAKSSVRPR